jgi:hypothetical protein
MPFFSYGAGWWLRGGELIVHATSISLFNPDSIHRSTGQDAEMMRLQLLGDTNLMEQLRAVRPRPLFA